jgi:prolyl-tRNA synthetase
VLAARRDTREKLALAMDGLPPRVLELLNDIQRALLERARQFQADHTTDTTSYAEFTRIMEGRPGFVHAPWCGDEACEAAIKTETQATIRNLPLDAAPPAGPCLKCGRPAIATALFAKAY